MEIVDIDEKDIDETDKKILHYLNENAKMSSRELARILKVHPNTLLQRIKKMEESKRGK